MFPYPSGRIHMGHVRNYTMGDVVARYKRAKGFNVLHPMGWDAFGMPAENAAIQNKTHPAKWTYENIAAMKSQLKSMGLSLDWSREIATCDPSYYVHQQRLFLDMYAKGLAYRRKAKVNWDPEDQTVLANEQVIDGRGWRSGALVEQREREQWAFKITEYADDLLAALDTLDKWPEKVRVMQANWIDRSEGMEVRFALDPKHRRPRVHDELLIYTTRHDTLFGASFMAIAPDHPLAKAAAAKDAKLAAFCDECRRSGTSVADLETAEKKGYDTGVRAVHPFDPNWTLPVYVANFVLMEYGTGAIFGCPAHDQRDIDFASKYKLKITAVVAPKAEPARAEAIAQIAAGTPYLGRRRPDQFAISGRQIDCRGQGGGRPPPGKRQAWRRSDRPPQGQFPPARLGYLAAALLGLPNSSRPLRDLRARAGPSQGIARQIARRCHVRSAGQSAGPSPNLEERAVSQVRQAGHAGNGHHGHVR